MSLSKDRAETLALNALEWLVAHDELLGTFMGSTGASVDDVKASAENPEFLGSVLDFILMDDTWIQEFCDLNNHSYETPFQARQMLPGGDVPNWT